MTTNQTIDGVRRDLLERCARELSIGIGPAPKNRAQELRALLDATAHPCPVQLDGCDGSCAPAAQPQGEPVAWRRIKDVFGCKKLITDRQYKANSARIQSFYEPFACAKCAEQPAPVAVAPGDYQEFSLCWFEESQQWVVIFPSGKTIATKFGVMGYAKRAALKYLGLGEADFDVTEDNGDFYRYERCEADADGKAKEAVCRGDKSLGTACGSCKRCKARDV